MNKYKDLKFLYLIYQNSKRLFVRVNPINIYKFEFSYHLWLPFLDQPQSDVVVFAIGFLVLKKIVKKWKHGISTYDKITFNENWENVSTEVIESTNIDESLHEEALVNLKLEHI